MRTTVTLDPDVLRAARNLARARSISLGAALSELVRRGLDQSRIGSEGGHLCFRVPLDAKPITREDVKRIEDEP